MCGISGHYHFSREHRIDQEALEKSLKTLSRRGPDGQLIKIYPGAGLGHARLSIIDLRSEANQPMTDSSERYTLIFNGEILNFQDLKKELNYSFQTNSDSEVLLAAYIQWGEACLKRLQGFFAFVIYDKQEHSLFAARDHFGMKPFVYSIKNNSFYFASELKALDAYPISKKLSSQAMDAFFQLSYIPGEQGIFESVKRLLPGHFLKIRDSKISIDRFYSLSEVKDQSLSFDAAKEKLSSLVNAAADQWIISDAPLGAFLGGGIDSSIVVALASQRIKNLKTFSVTFPESQFHDEGPFARAVAERYATAHTEIPLTTDNIYQSIDQVLAYLDEPFADSSAIPTFALSQQVGKSIRVALSGDGADEVFGGYEKHKAEILAHKWQKILIPAAGILSLTKNLPQSRDHFLTNQFRKANRFLEGIQLDSDSRYLRWCSAVAPEIAFDLRIKNASAAAWEKNLNFMKNDRFRGINKTLYRDMQMVLPNDMLTKIDMMSMANSLEVRPLLLDHSIVDFSFSLPGNFKATEQKKKILLLETFKHLLPETVYNRPKHGFSVELLPFFRGGFWDQINEVYLSDKLIKEQGLFNPQTIQKLKSDIKSGTAKDIQALAWELICFQNFWLKFKLGTASL
jgi:asparagine synthase (glutamine-hydrolysing)